MAQLIPYLDFDNNCREAMTFYKDCLGGELTLQTVGEMPEMAAHMPPHMSGSILHAALTSGNIVIYGSDLNRHQRIEGNTIRLCVNCASADELNSFFSALSAGGQIIQPVEATPWAVAYGELTDKYGKHWIFNVPL